MAAIGGVGTSAMLACSCFGPESFCETLNPPFPSPEWWIPDAVVLGVKLGDYQHGMDVKIVQSFSGVLQADDTIRVWGDCGLLCRHYPDTWNVGDTVIWGFRYTDLAGNSLCGTSYEQPGDYMISICGVYFLDYNDGIVSGPITSSVSSTMSIDLFGQLVEGCLSTGMNEANEVDPLTVCYDGTVPVIQMQGISNAAELCVFDALGRSMLSRSWDGSALRIEMLGSGAYLLEVRNGSARQVKRLVVR